MTVRHIFALLATSMYLVLVGFTDFKPLEAELFGHKITNLIPLTPMEVVPTIYPKTQTAQQTKLSYEEHIEKEKAAKAISKMYRNIDYKGAMQLVTSIYDHAKTHGLRPSLILAMVATESSFKRTARSTKGAVGYLQVIPKYHWNKIRGRNLWDTDVNVQVGTLVLKECYRKHKNEKRALACYNGATTPEKAEQYYRQVARNQYALKQAIARVI